MSQNEAVRHVSSQRQKLLVFGFCRWKRFIRYWFPGRRVIMGTQFFNDMLFWLFWRWAIAFIRPHEILCWSYQSSPGLIDYCRDQGVPLVRVEDGFLRSVKLGAMHVEPLSLCFDRSGYLYFDASGPSDLEQILETYDFDADPDLVRRAEAGIEALIQSRLSKYNISKDADVEAIYGPKIGKRILVLGQVDGDKSILKGCDTPIDNNRFVRLVAAENPDAQIIYKPHPELLKGIRKYPPQTNPDDVRDVALVLDGDIALADAFHTVDQVYTMTSLAGFEALLRGLSVSCYGMPFYAGWGVTEDRQICSRRTARRSVVEIFAAAYILYAQYRNPETHAKISFEEALALLAEMKQRAAIDPS
jgi:capsular polysaccharide export protein